MASIAIPVPSSSSTDSTHKWTSGHQQSGVFAPIGGSLLLSSPTKTLKGKEEKEEEEAQERRMRKREEEERKRERELFLSGKATPPPAMVRLHDS